MIFKLGMQHLGPKLYKVYINDILRQGQIGSNVRLKGENCYKFYVEPPWEGGGRKFI